MGLVKWWRQVVRRNVHSAKRKKLHASRSRYSSSKLWLERLEDRTLLSAGDLDPFFGVGGFVIQDFNPSDHAYDVARQADGKYVVVGDTGDPGAEQMLIARFNADGTLDDGTANDSTPLDTFGTNGFFTIGFGADNTGFARSVSIQPDGNIVVAGSYIEGTLTHLAVARLDTDGNLDASFNFGGTVTTQVDETDYYRSVAIQPDGKIIAVGSSGLANDTHTLFTVVRYNSDGTLDDSFGQGGVVREDLGSRDAAANDVVLQRDGQIVVVGHSSTATDNFHFVTFRFNSDGTPDTTFSGDGKILDYMPGGKVGASDEDLTSVAIQATGEIVAAGSYQHNTEGFNIAVLRYNADGTPDTTFNDDGRLAIDLGADESAFALGYQGNGKLVMGGMRVTSNPADQLIVRLNPDGTLDSGFGNAGVVLTDIGAGTYDDAQSVFIQSDGFIVAAGTVGDPGASDVGLVRLEGDVPIPPVADAGGPYEISYAGGSVQLDSSGTIDPEQPISSLIYSWDLDGDGIFGETGSDAANGDEVGPSPTFTTGLGNLGDQFTVTLQVTDAWGLTSTAVSTVTLVDTLPIADAGGPYHALEQTTTVQLDGSGSFDLETPSSDLVYEWDLNGNGIFGETGAAATNGDEVGVNPTFNVVGIDGPQQYVVTLRVTDSDGLSSTDTAIINIDDVPPSVQIDSVNNELVPGQATTLSVSATDVSTADQAANFTYTADWGDQTTDIVSAPSTAQLSHIYTKSGFYVLQVTATDKDGGVSLPATRLMTVRVIQLEPNPDDPALTDLVVGGTLANDGILFKPGATPGTVNVTINGVLHTTDVLGRPLAPTGRIVAYGQAGNDSITVGGTITLTAVLYGDDGNDVLRGGRGDDELFGGAGNDKIFGGIGNDTISGGDGDDYLQGDQGDDTIYGDAGNDQLLGSSGNDHLLGGDGDDYLGAFRNSAGVFIDDPGDDLMEGGDGNDRINGGTGNDTLSGDAGNDTLQGRDGNDLEYGGDGDDLIYGGIGNDQLFGGNGSDTLQGDDGNDLLLGEADDDNLIGGNGNDHLVGGDGNDRLGAFRTATTFFDDAGSDTMEGGNGNDVINGGSGNDWLYGDAGDDTLMGGADNDVLVGGDGNDILLGGAGRDILIGGTGADQLTGHIGEDILIAGTTSFDADRASLQLIWNEWNRTDIAYVARVNHVTGASSTGLNGTTYFNATTVQDDSEVDVLTGMQDLDLFFAQQGGGSLDVLTDKLTQETVIEL